MDNKENDFYLFTPFGIDRDKLDKPETTIYHLKGVVVKVDQTGHIPNPSYGGWLISYSLKGEEFSYTKYIDHQCVNDVFDEPCQPDSIPKEVMNILGKSLEDIQQQYPEWIYQEQSLTNS